MIKKSQAPISENLISFFRDLLNHGFDDAIKKVHPVSIDDFINFFLDLSETYAKNSYSDTNPRQPIFNAVLNFFRQDNWQFKQLGLETVLCMFFQGKNAQWICYAKAREIQKHFVFYSICPVQVPESKLQSIAEFITRVNYDIIIGNFELDFSSGEIRYKTSIDLKNEKLTFNSIKNLVYNNVNIMDKYIPGIISIINDDISPLSVINKIEQIADIPSLLNEQTQPLAVISPDNQSAQTTGDYIEHILSILTPEEIGEFHQISQMIAPYQQKKVAEMIKKLENKIVIRLGDLGAETFIRATNFFQEFKLPAKNLKLIQRYSGLTGQTKLLLQNFYCSSQQYEGLLINSEAQTAILELNALEKLINERLQELPTEKFAGRKEVELLIELEEFRQKISFFQTVIHRIVKEGEDEIISP